MKIGVVFTGGTIGSMLARDGYISPDGEAPFKLIDMYRSYASKRMGTGAFADMYTAANAADSKDDVEFVVSQPYMILSEMLDAPHILKLIKHVGELSRTDLDGIIVTHGTDTLQYSAAFLSYAAGISSIPIVLVSADYPLEDKRSNGLENFDCAVEFIRRKKGTGVFISYKNKEDAFVTIHRGTRTVAHMPYSASLFSVDNQYYAKFDGNNPEFNKLYAMPKESAEDVLLPDEKNFAEAAALIQRVSAYPGMEYPQILPQTKAVLLESYHSGTLCTDEKFHEYARGLWERGVSLFVTGFDKGKASYETTAAYGDLRLTLLPKMSPISAYCKLWLLLSGKRDLNDMNICMAEDFV